MQQQRYQRARRKEYAVHDGKRKAGLEHGARLVGLHAKGAEVDGEGHAVIIAAGRSRWPTAHVDAVNFGDLADVVRASDEGAHETQVDEGDEGGVASDGVALEERYESPDAG